MGSTQRPRVLFTAAVVSSAFAMLCGSARAQVTSERPGSILIFPKVVRTANVDTRIEISNTYTMPNFVRCFYIDAEIGDTNQPLCTHTDFDLTLTKQQPTQWSVGAGRPVRVDVFGAPNSGLDPGVIPPVAAGFTGALICAEVGADGLPTGLSKLTGAATIVDVTGDESRYNAIAIPANGAVGKDIVLDLGTEYAACPAVTEINLAAVGGQDPVLGAGSTQGAILTLVPCQFNIESGIATNGSATFNAFNEFEQLLSGSLNYSCIGNIDLSTVSAVKASSAGGQLNTPFGYLALTANPPAVGVLTTVHTSGAGDVATASRNLHGSGIGASTQIRIVE